MEVKDYNFEERIVSLLTDDNLLPKLISHNYGNYVVQKSLIICSQLNKGKILKVAIFEKKTYLNFL